MSQETQISTFFGGCYLLRHYRSLDRLSKEGLMSRFGSPEPITWGLFIGEFNEQVEILIRRYHNFCNNRE